MQYYGSGEVESKGNYKNGKKIGEWVSYFESGGVSSKGNYKDDKKHNWPQILKHFDKSKLSVPKYAKKYKVAESSLYAKRCST